MKGKESTNGKAPAGRTNNSDGRNDSALVPSPAGAAATPVRKGKHQRTETLERLAAELTEAGERGGSGGMAEVPKVILIDPSAPKPRALELGFLPENQFGNYITLAYRTTFHPANRPIFDPDPYGLYQTSTAGRVAQIGLMLGWSVGGRKTVMMSNIARLALEFRRRVFRSREMRLERDLAAEGDDDSQYG